MHVHRLLVVLFAFASLSIACKPRADQSALRADEAESSPASTDQVRFIIDNADAWLTRWQLIKNATQTVDMTYYIIDDDVYGFAMLGLLKQKMTDDHIKVRVMVDARGTHNLSRKGLGQGYLQELVRLGAQVKIYNPTIGSPTAVLNAGTKFAAAREAAAQFQAQGLDAASAGELFEQLMSGQSSNHDKTMVVDGEYVVTGGRNIGKPYFTDQALEPMAYYDADIYVHSKELAAAALKSIEIEFNRSENFSVNRPLTNLHKSGNLEIALAAMQAKLSGQDIPANATAFRDDLDHLGKIPELSSLFLITPDSDVLLDNTSNLFDPNAKSYADRDKSHAQITEGILDMVKNAQKRVWFINPYVSFTPELEAALVDAGNRGVDIQLVTNSVVSTDSFLTQAIFNGEWPDLLAKVKGLHIYANKGPGKLHAKFMIVDDNLSLISSYNLDAISQNVNSEVAVKVQSAQLNEQVAAAIQQFVKDRTVEYTVDADGKQHGAREFWPDAPQLLKVEGLYPIASRFRDHI